MLVYYRLHVVVVQGDRKVLALSGGLVYVLKVTESPRVFCVEADPRLEGKNLRYLDGRGVQTLDEPFLSEFQPLQVDFDGIVECGDRSGLPKLELVLRPGPLGIQSLRVLLQIQLKDETRERL